MQNRQHSYQLMSMRTFFLQNNVAGRKEEHLQEDLQVRKGWIAMGWIAAQAEGFKYP